MILNFNVENSKKNQLSVQIKPHGGIRAGTNILELAFQKWKNRFWRECIFLKKFLASVL